MQDWELRVATFKARVQAITNLPPEVIFKRSVLNIREGAGVLDKVLTGRRYRTVLEIGTYRGISAAYMAPLVDRVITIDLIEGRLEHWPGQAPPWNREAVWRALGLNNVELWLVKDNVEKKALVDGLSFDLAFIDGGKVDIAEDFALTKRCGAVLFHDYDKHGDQRDVVYNFVNSLPREQVKIMDLFALWEEA